MPDSPDAPKREEQVLVLAAAGLTDKEIALRLGISPDTVGTYWRRILAKYQAASRTEVVARYMEHRGKAALQNLQYVNECLQLMNEHMLAAGASGGVAHAILASLSEWVLLVDSNGVVRFSNRPGGVDKHLTELFESDDVGACLEYARRGTYETRCVSRDGQGHTIRLTPGVGAAEGHVIVCARPD